MVVKIAITEKEMIIGVMVMVMTMENGLLKLMMVNKEQLIVRIMVHVNIVIGEKMIIIGAMGMIMSMDFGPGQMKMAHIMKSIVRIMGIVMFARMRNVIIY